MWHDCGVRPCNMRAGTWSIYSPSENPRSQQCRHYIWSIIQSSWKRHFFMIMNIKNPFQFLQRQKFNDVLKVPQKKVFTTKKPVSVEHLSIHHLTRAESMIWSLVVNIKLLLGIEPSLACRCAPNNSMPTPLAFANIPCCMCQSVNCDPALINIGFNIQFTNKLKYNGLHIGVLVDWLYYCWYNVVAISAFI